MKYLRDYFFIILGTAIAGFGIACFVTPAKIAPGGVNGIATIVYYLLGLDTGLTMLVVSIPLFLIGIKIFGPLYGAKSFFGMLLLSLFVTLFGQLTDYRGFLDYSDKIDILLSAIFGGVLLGGGVGTVMKAGANTGGTDIVAQILCRYTGIPLGNALFLCDGLIVVAGGLAFGFERALFALCTLYISGQMVNYVVMNMGNRYAKTAYIVSPAYETIGKRIIAELHHGGTVIDGVGIFTGQNRKLLMAVVPNMEITHLTKIVHEEDAQAFMFVLETYQVLGFGFVPMQKVLEGNKSMDIAVAKKKKTSS